MEIEICEHSRVSTMEGASSRPAKRLIFDRRYGWIVDEWKDPAEVALSGGRGMFCVLPIAKSLVKLSSFMVNYGLDSANQFLKSSNQTSSTLSNAHKSNWFSEIEKIGCTAELELPASRIDIPTL